MYAEIKYLNSVNYYLTGLKYELALEDTLMSSRCFFAITPLVGENIPFKFLTISRKVFIYTNTSKFATYNFPNRLSTVI